MADPYDDPYANPLTALYGGPQTVGNPDAAQHYLDQHRTAFQQREKEREGLEAKQQLNANQMSKILEEATSAIRKGREGRTNTPMLAMAAGLMGPGNIGDQIGRGFSLMGPAIQQQRQQDDTEESQIAQLGLKSMEAQNAPLAQKLQYLRALQTGDISAMRAIEQAQVRTQAPGKAGSDERKFALWRQTPGNENKNYEDWRHFEQETQARTPADMQYQERMNKERAAQGLPPLSLPEAGALRKQIEQEGAARGHAQGTAQAAALQNLPTAITVTENLDRTIEKLINNPKLKQYIGTIQGQMPNVSQGSVDFQALLETLKGQQFKTAFETLKGAGAITDIEGTKATDAMGNINPRQSPEQFIATLRDIQRQARQGIQVGRQKAGIDPLRTEVPGTPQGQTGLSKPGTIAKGVQAIHPDTGAPLTEGQTAEDKKTGQRLIVKGGVWIGA